MSCYLPTVFITWQGHQTEDSKIVVVSTLPTIQASTAAAAPLCQNCGMKMVETIEILGEGKNIQNSDARAWNAFASVRIFHSASHLRNRFPPKIRVRENVRVCPTLKIFIIFYVLFCRVYLRVRYDHTGLPGGEQEFSWKPPSDSISRRSGGAGAEVYLRPQRRALLKIRVTLKAITWKITQKRSVKDFKTTQKC